MLTIILALLPFIIFSIMVIDFYITAEREKKAYYEKKERLYKILEEQRKQENIKKGVTK